MTLHAIPPHSARRVAALFSERVTLRAVADAVLEGRAGQALADDPERPGAARLDLGCYTFFGGSPASLDEDDLGGVARPREIVLPEDGSWDPGMRALLGSSAVDRPMNAYVLDDPDAGALRRWAGSVAEPFRLVSMELHHAAQLDRELEPHALQAYPHPDAFTQNGLGCCALEGARVVCAATTYTLASRSAEIAIATRPAARRHGLATAVAAQLLSLCLDRGVLPHWNASNPVSQRLALRLGFRQIGVCPILYLPGDPLPRR